MIIRLKILLVPVLAALLAGCGSNFEWFPQSNGFTNHSTAVVTAPGTVIKEISFPAGVTWASDISYDKNRATFWMLAGTTGTPTNAPVELVQINAADGSVVTIISQTPGFVWPFEITGESTMVYDGTYFWMTSHARNGGIPSKVFQLLSNGMYQGNSYPCPANTTGFCRGLAWDSTTSSLWSAASDTTILARSQVQGGVLSLTPLPNSGLWSGVGVTDVSFDSASGEVFILKDGIIRVKGNSGAALGTIPFTVPGNGRGDWDGQYFWVVDNSVKKIKALFVR